MWCHHFIQVGTDGLYIKLVQHQRQIKGHMQMMNGKNIVDVYVLGCLLTWYECISKDVVG